MFNSRILFTGDYKILLKNPNDFPRMWESYNEVVCLGRLPIFMSRTLAVSLFVLLYQ